MGCNRKPTNTLPTPCQQLADARAAMVQLLSGSAVAAIETPTLGRVEYVKSPNGVADLQRLIDDLAAQCALATGDVAGYYRARRRPISMEAWP